MTKAPIAAASVIYRKDGEILDRSERYTLRGERRDTITYAIQPGDSLRASSLSCGMDSRINWALFRGTDAPAAILACGDRIVLGAIGDIICLSVRRSQ